MTGVLSTGFADLDSSLGGLKPGQVVAVTGSAGVGKSALALDIARHVAAAGIEVLIFSYGASAAEIGIRLLVAESGVPWSKGGERPGTAQWARLVDSAAHLEPMLVALAPCQMSAEELGEQSWGERQFHLALQPNARILRQGG